MPTLNKDILKKQASNLKKVYIEEWDCDVYFKKLAVKDAIVLEKMNSKKGITGTETLLNIIMLACVDEKGEPCFQPEDRDDLLTIDNSVLNKLASLAEEGAEVDKNDVEDKAKNS